MDVAMAFGANHPIQLAEFTAEDVSVEEQQGVKGLVLGGSRHMLAHRQVGEEAAHLLASKVGCRAAAHEALKPGNPEAVGRVAPGSGADWSSSPTAAEAWLRWATDWFLEASLARKGPRLAGAPAEWPYLWQESKQKRTHLR